MKKLILICMLTALLLLVACKEKQPDADDLVPPSVPGGPEAPVVEEQEPVPAEMLSELKCSDNRIEAVFANTEDETLELTQNVKILINGLPPVSDPECEKLVLAPGESTFCSDITGHYAIREGVNTLQLNLKSSRIVEYVDCKEE